MRVKGYLRSVPGRSTKVRVKSYTRKANPKRKSGRRKR